jgi:hypothetical protein
MEYGRKIGPIGPTKRTNRTNMNGRYGSGIGDEEEKYKLRVSVIDKERAG